MMQPVDSKWRILREAGYTYDFRRMVYVNRRTKKVFSFEFVEDHSEDELRRRINEHSNRVKWCFYFNSPPAASVQRELENVLG